LPGQSVSEEIERVRDVALGDNFVLLAITAGVTAMTGVQWLLGTPPKVLFFVSLASFVGSLVYVVPRMKRAREQVRRLRQGQAGERAVAEYLDTLRDPSVRALHDLVGDNFNVDHVVVAPQGIFVLETKTISKPVNRDVRVVFNGELVTLDGYVPPRNPVVQVKAAATWVRRLLKEALDRDYAVRPVLLFPGWFVERTEAAKRSPVWVLEPKAFGPFLRKEPVVLSESEVAQVVYFLKRYSRATPERV
jgi:membrane protein implicated in regulation of membrane protease activity